MVATVLELIGIPRPPIGLRMSSSPPAAAPLISSAAAGGGGGRGSILPEFRGLRLSVPPRRASSASSSVITKCDRKRVVVCEAQESTALEVPDVTKETWQSLVMESDRPVLVEFWAEWCGPCIVISPVIAKMSKVYESRLKCFKLNTDESPDIVTQYGVRSIPTIIIFNNGEKKETIIGSVPESTLVTYIDRFLER